MADILRFAKMLLGKGELDGVRILSESAVSAMLSPALPEGLDGLARGENIGIGTFVISGVHRLPKGTVYSHGAYGTHLLIHPERNIAAVFLKNSFFQMATNAPATRAFEEAVLQ